MNQNLEDIARLAGVSRSTVSRVINNHPNVNSATRQHVLKVIEEQQFKPNHIARALVTRRTQVISLVIPQPVSLTFSDPFLAMVTEHVIQQARKNGYAVMLWVGYSDETSDQYYERILGNSLSDGILVVAAVNNDTLIPRLIAANFPFTVIGGPITSGINYIDIDNFQGGYEAVAHLIEQGCTRIAMINGPQNMPAANRRLQGYCAALKDCSEIDFDEALIIEGNYTEVSGYQGMHKLIQQSIDGLFTGNDLMALGAMRRIHEHGLNVPDDIKVIGFDDIPVARHTTPTLSTIGQPTAQLGVTATQLLIDLIEGKNTTPHERIFPVELIVRETTTRKGVMG